MRVPKLSIYLLYGQETGPELLVFYCWSHQWVHLSWEYSGPLVCSPWAGWIHHCFQR
ncbi:hypothetical protein Hanom_Chr16g01415851 [Helianthus anomalus]